MRLIDDELPAARYLVGADAVDVLRLPIEATGGVIESARPVQVQYRPGSDVVVRYSASVSWQGGPAKRETLVAASAVHREYPGAVHLTAGTPFGEVAVGVWKWPFDPMVVGLGDVVSVAKAASFLGLDDVGSVTVDIVAYRPTERSVIRVSRDGEAVAYIKAVVPSRTSAIVDRHVALAAAGVPVPRVMMSDDVRGLVALEAVHGATLRELIKADAPGWPAPAEFDRLADSLTRSEVGGRGPNSPVRDGVLHARMLSVVAPSLATPLAALVDRFEALDDVVVDGTVHGDLHEGQLIVDAGRIVGLLDIDDVGPGSSIDDAAAMLAHVHYRAVTGDAPDRLERYAAELREAGSDRHDVDQLDVRTAAVMVGLATGPFRIQAPGWLASVGALIARATEISMRELSE